jgi:uncharacterized protein
LFAVFHDSRRVNECTDYCHGQRGAALAAELRGQLFDLPDADFDLLHQACVDHTDGLLDGDITMQTCWDADRLDLGRVGTDPDPRRLCTAAAKAITMRKWADGRACFEVVPDLVRNEWAV